MIYLYEEDMALNNLQELICHKTQTTRLTQQMKKHAIIVALKEQYKDTEIARFLKDACWKIFRCQISKGDPTSAAKR